MRIRPLLALSAAMTAILLLVSCTGGEPSTGTTPKTATPTTPPPTTTTPPAATTPKQMSWPTAPAMTISQSKTYTATIKTNYGDVVVELFPKEAPLAVNSFVFLARQGYFDGIKFHRVVKGFVIQGGDPTGTGGGNPGYRFADEPVTRDYLPGTLAMANSGANTNGSQFFICLADLRTNLQKKYTIFGNVKSGFDVVQKIGDVPVTLNAVGERSSPTVDVHIVTVIIEEK